MFPQRTLADNKDTLANEMFLLDLQPVNLQVITN